MKALIVIPARTGSKRVESKPLIKILGQTAIKWVTQIASKCNNSNGIVVCSDNQEVLDEIKNEKVIVSLSKKKYRDGTERAFDYALNLLEKPPLILVFNCGEVMIEPKTLDELIEKVSSGSCDLATCIQEVSGFDMADSSAIKVALSSRDEVLFLSRSPFPFPIPFSPNSSGTEKFWKHIGVTCYSLKAAIEIFTSKKCDAENIEDIDLLGALNCHLKIETVKMPYKTACLNYLDSVVDIETSISSQRKSLGKPSRKLDESFLKRSK